MIIRWSNVPISEIHLGGIIAGTLLHVAFPLDIFNWGWMGHALGWPVLAAGLLLAGWAVVEAGDADISSSPRLLVTGPYAFSRNPMYLAWTLIALGLALVINTLWLLLALLPVVLLTHFLVIRREEERLRQQFGEEYRQYCQEVRRYL